MDRQVWIDWVSRSSWVEPLVRFSQEFSGIMELLSLLSLILGLFIIIWTVVSFLQRKRSRSDNGAGTRLGWGLIGGSLMIQLKGTLETFSGSLWGVSDLPTAMQYADQAAGASADPIKAALYGALGMLVVIGWVIGLRSCYQLSQVGDKMGHGDGTGQFWSAFTSLCFSSVLINMLWVADVLSSTFTDSTFTTSFSL